MSAVASDPAAAARPIVAWRRGERVERADLLAPEEPLEIRFSGLSVAVTMRTPGHDRELAAGFLFTEGIIRSAADIAHVGMCDTGEGAEAGNVVNVNPTDPALVRPERWQRSFFMTSSCGICGTGSIDQVRRRAEPVVDATPIAGEVLLGLSDRLRAAQRVFDETGGLHAAGLFAGTGDLLLAREDVGRHNAVDKVIGALLLRDVDVTDHVDGLPVLRDGRPDLSGCILLVSGRASFEIVQKAWVAGVPVVAAVSAPSSLAVDLAQSAGITLVGFLRSHRFNVYSLSQRLV